MTARVAVLVEGESDREAVLALAARRGSDLEGQGELESFRVLQRQPAQRGRRAEDHLHRFLGAGSGRKVRYGRLLVEALAAEEVPPPLARVLADALACR